MTQLVRVFLLLGACAIIPTLPKAALADACGQALGQPQVDIRLEFTKPKLDISRRLRALIDDPSLSHTRSPAFPYTLGVTQMSMSGGLNVNIEGNPRSDGMFCWSVKTLEITVKAASTVYIAAEIPRESCLWREVQEHEAKHIAVNRQHFQQFAALIRPQALDATRRTMVAAGGAEAKAFFQAALDNVVQDAQARFEAAVLDQHREIDTTEEYNRVSKACDTAEMRAVLSRAGIQ